ncbi:outer membrane protein assembly factor BamC [Limnohabitans sp.]|uniref:outer membrane protein assembly factor BamC n=1 Tax=Limnohabitans sp. TaxID=1907725 RepID=UPI00286F2A6C|nr:outer membrane protein assembly factor BamC [Limnohabitans sp.]
MDSDKVNYKTEGGTKVVPLDIPPDLTQLTRDTRYAVPGGPVSASNMGVRTAVPTTATAAKQVNDVRIERDGKQRWLVVDRSADVVWPLVQAFWKDNGFEYVVEQQQLGLLETEWAENRAKIPQDFLRRTLGKVLDGLYSSGERDKFRTRIERNNTGGVDIFVTHRGMSEEYKDQTKTSTIWTPRPSDPELEAEFLSRLMVKLGVSAQTATVAASPTELVPPKTNLVTKGEATLLSIPDSFDVAWRRVGLSLDRTGFTVEDRDRAQGVYFVRYVDSASKEEKGFFSKMFSNSTPDTGPVKYRIAVRQIDGKTSEVTVQNTAGATENTPITQRILKLLADDLR